MKKEQILKLLITMMIMTALMLVFEIIFDIPIISNSITDWVARQNGALIYITIGLIMFLQVSVIPVPAMIVITAAIGAKILRTDIGLSLFTQGSTWLFVLTTMIGYMIGVIVSYFIGYKWGRKAVKWCAGSDEDYDKWVNFLSNKGKLPYFLTILLPVFPDDILVLCTGAIKMNFGFVFIANLIGRGIGLLTTIFSLTLIGVGGGSPIALIAWCVALVAELIAFIVIKYRKQKVSKESEKIEE